MPASWAGNVPNAEVIVAMAGDWIKMEAATPDKPEVLAISARMGWDDPDMAVGKLFRVWRWFDQHTTDGNARGVTSALLDRIAGVTGFAEAMQSVGWLSLSSEGVELPNFDRHCGKTAKDRAQTAKRVAAHKSNAKGNDSANGNGNAASVTTALPREEKKLNPPKPPKGPRFDISKIEIPQTINRKAWAEWVEQRNSGRKKLTQGAVKKQFELLAKFDHFTQQRIIDDSIRNDWQGLFEPKGPVMPLNSERRGVVL